MQTLKVFSYQCTQRHPLLKFHITDKTTTHVPCGYAYVIIGLNGKRVKQSISEVYRGTHAVENFLSEIVKKKRPVGGDFNEFETDEGFSSTRKSISRSRHLPYLQTSLR